MKQLSKINGKIYNENIMLENPLLFFLLKEGKTSVKRLINKHGEVEACQVTEYKTSDIFTLANKLACVIGGAVLTYGLLILLIGLAPMPR